MENENAALMLAAGMYIVKTREEIDFMPTIATVIHAARELGKESVSSGEECWSRGPLSRQHTEFEQEIWRLWGGSNRWGALPDPKYCEDVQEAQRTLGFARKEFLELYEASSTSAAKKQDFLTHREALAVGTNLKKFGIDINAATRKIS